MAIEKIKIVNSYVENLLDKVDLNWRKKPLYKWQYGGEHPERSATAKIFDLRKYKEIDAGDFTIYVRKGEIILEKSNNFGFTDVLTNVPPYEDSQSDKPREITINKLEILWS